MCPNIDQWATALLLFFIQENTLKLERLYGAPRALAK